MKKLLIIISFLLALTFADQITLFQEAKVRSTPTAKTEDNVLCVANKGTYDVIEVYSIYVKIVAGDIEGYVGSKLIADGKIKSPGCKVRDVSGNETDKTLKTGTEVKILEQPKDWYKISVNGKTGWIYKVSVSK